MTAYLGVFEAAALTEALWGHRHASEQPARRHGPGEPDLEVVVTVKTTRHCREELGPQRLVPALHVVGGGGRAGLGEDVLDAVVVADPVEENRAWAGAESSGEDLAVVRKVSPSGDPVARPGPLPGRHRADEPSPAPPPWPR